MSKNQVNGDTGFSSEFFSHITSYPFITDSINFYKSRPLGAKSIDLADNLYNSLGKPIISMPLVQTPLSIISPYARQVDHIGASTLDTVDHHVPAIKNTGFKEIHQNASAAVSFPFQVAGSGRDYVLNTYGDERKKTPEQGLFGTGKAALSTELRIASEALHAVADYLGPKKDQAKEQYGDLIAKGQEKAGEIKQWGLQRSEDAKKQGEDVAQKGQEKAGELQKRGQQKGEEAKQQFNGQ